MLLQAIREHPLEDTPRLMYADGLEDTDAARAEFIRLQILKPVRSRVHNSRAAKLFHANWRRWVPEPFRASEVEFLRGFIAGVDCDCPKFIEHAGELFRVGAVERVKLRGRRAEGDHVPVSYEEGAALERFYIWKRITLPQTWNTWIDDPAKLPSELHALLPRMTTPGKYLADYEHRKDAHADLAIAALAYGKMQAAKMKGVPT